MTTKRKINKNRLLLVLTVPIWIIPFFIGHIIKFIVDTMYIFLEFIVEWVTEEIDEDD